MANSTNETALALIKGESFDSSFVSNEISQDKLTKESNSASNKNVVFRTEVNNNEFETKFEYGDKLLMNRLSARKSRLKKKKYVKCLEEETARLKNEIFLKKNIQTVANNINLDLSLEDKEKNDKFFNKFILFEKQEKEVKLKGQKKQAEIMKQYENLQKTLLREMLVKQIHCFMPLRLQIFGDKFIKLIEINEDDEAGIWTDLVETQKSLRLRFVLLFIVTAAVFAIDIIQKLFIYQKIGMFGNELGILSNDGIVFANLIGGVLGMILCSSVMISGLGKIFKGKADCDSVCAVSCTVSLLASILNLIDTNDLQQGRAFIYIPAALLGLLLNSV
jgi:hypothetical protein